MKLFDCPNCGRPIELPPNARSAKVLCGSCGGRFVMAHGKSTGSKPVPPRTTTNSSTATPTSDASPPTKTTRRSDDLLPLPNKTPAAGNSLVRSGSAPKHNASTEILIATNSRSPVAADIVLLQAEIRRTRRQRMALLYVGILLAACGVAVYLVTNPPGLLLKSKSAAIDSDSDDLTDQRDVTQSPATNKNESKVESSKASPSDEIKPEPPKPIAWGKSRNLPVRELEKIWAQLQPYTLKLIAHDAHGERVLTGVMIDSRGWIATSLSAIQGARSVLATTSPVNPLSDEGAELLSDEVRGVLAIDRQHDLVLLQVNRRLVNFITPLAPTDKLLVGGRTLIQIAAVGPERQAWLTECRVNSEVAREKFDPDLSNRINQMQLDLSPYWPAHDLPLQTGPGGPLFTPDGKLAGINTGLADSKQNFFVEARWLDALAKNAKEPAASLNTLIPQHAKATSAARGDSDVDYSKGANPFPPDHPAYQIAQDLADRSMICESFAWQPSSPDQLRDLENALLAYREALLQIRERKLIRMDSDLLRSQFGFWSNRLNSTILGNDEASQTDLNQLSLGESLNIRSEDAASIPAVRAVLFVQVIVQAGSSPRQANHDTITVRIVGQDRHLVLPVDDQTATMLPDSTWLVVAEIEPASKVTVANGPEHLTAQRGSHFWDIAEVRGANLFGPPIPEDKSNQDADRAENDNHQN